MPSTLKTLDPTQVELEISITAEEFGAAQDAAFRSLSRNAKVPGFRPGKVPRKIFESQYGTGAILDRALNDLIPGRVDVMFNNIGAVLPLIQGGKLRGLAVTTAKRSSAVPDLPTIAESGVPGFDVSSWYAIFLPVKTPREIVRKANADMATVLADPITKERLEKLGVVVGGSTPEGLAAYLKSEMDKWGPVIKAAGIKGDE